MTATISIRTDRASYRVSDPVQLTISNTTKSSFYFNPCTRILERENGGTWREVAEDRMCTMIAHVLNAGETRRETTDFSESLQPGRYRLIVQFTEEAPGGREARSVRAVTAPITLSR